MTEYAVRNPATGELVRRYDTATDADIKDAIDRAQSAYREWGRRTSVAERAALVRRVAELHTERTEQLADLIVEEMGKPRDEAVGEVEFTPRSTSTTQTMPRSSSRTRRSRCSRARARAGSPASRSASCSGSCRGTSRPTRSPVRRPNLCLGNTILLKHAPQCPSSSAFLKRIFADAGFPEHGAYVNIYASNEQAADIIADPRIQGVSVTGSERAGAAVAEVAGRNLKKVVLELGGSDPFLVLGTDDMDATVEAALAARLGNTGQACNAGKRFIVAEDLYDEFVDKFTAGILAAGRAPLSSTLGETRLMEQIARAEADGATLVAAAGERDGAHVPSGVLTGVGRSSGTFHEELFGPVAMVFGPRTRPRRSSSPTTRPSAWAPRVHEQPRAGRAGGGPDRGGHGVRQSRRRRRRKKLPFGGVKRSGLGRGLGRFGIEEFVNRKMIRVG